ncbi:MAG: hypothetical protein RLZZ138_93 [Actinomycetota bacterium]|jgi:cytochrome b involved in lipid metabolism
MKNLLLMLLASSLLLSGCTANEPPTAASPAKTTGVTQAPEESQSSKLGDAKKTPQSETVTEEATEPDSDATSEPDKTSAPAPQSTETKTASPKPTASETPAPTPTQTSDPAGYTRAQVAEKNSRSACWVVVSGSVYNLTDWITKHPGGASAITALCGGDATDAFEGKHGGEARPSSILESYFLGPLVD